ncbi:S41 family peptidase [bacterium]|nr:S41 family peptidase [bacterium]
MLRSVLRNVLFGSALVASTIFADLTPDQRVEDFESFWQSYKNAYVFFDLKHKDHGVDWDSIKADFISKMRTSTSDLDLYKAVTEAQALLRDGHCYNSSFAKIRETERVYFQRIGLALVEGHKIVINKVPEGSIFAQKGLEIGDEIVKWDGKTIRQLAKAAKKMSSASSPGQFWNSFASSLYIHSPLLGKPKKSSVKLIFKKLNGDLVEVQSKWQSVDPTGKPETQSAWIDDEKGVSLDEASKVRIKGPLPFLKIDSWMKTEDPKQQLEDTFKKIQGTDGMVVDFRGNGGGVGPWGVLFSNYLISEGDQKKAKKSWISKIKDLFKGKKEETTDQDAVVADGKVPNDVWFERKLSKVFMRVSFPQLSEEEMNEIYSSPETMQYVLKKAFGMDVDLKEINDHVVNGVIDPFYVNLTLNDRTNDVATYTKPVYIFTDGGCYSTTDIALSILKDFDRIKTVGTPNGAGSGSPIPFVLPNSGLQVYVPHARAFPPSGTMIEGRPITPDFLVTQTIEDLRKGKDTVLTVAVARIMEEIMPAATFEQSDVSVGQLKSPVINWGNIPTPDFAIQATLEHQKRSETNLSD